MGIVLFFLIVLIKYIDNKEIATYTCANNQDNLTPWNNYLTASLQSGVIPDLILL